MIKGLLAIAMFLTSQVKDYSDVELLFAGDAMMHQAQLEAAYNGGNYDFTACFTPIKPIISAADYAVINLETPIGYEDFSGYPCFNAPISYAKALKEIGFDLFLTSNNHTLDRHDKGLKTTLSILDTLNIPHIGTYRNSSDREKKVPMITNVGGINIAFLNYTYDTNSIKIQGDVIVDYINRDRMAEDIKDARSNGAELVAICMHWGEEYYLHPVTSQKNLAQFLMHQGADIIIGGHPHVVEPYIFGKNKDTGKNYFLIYSVGNFISNMRTRDTRGGALAMVKIGRDKEGNAVIKDGHTQLIFTVPPSQKGENYTLYPIDSVPAMWQSKAEDFRNAIHTTMPE